MNTALIINKIISYQSLFIAVCFFLKADCEIQVYHLSFHLPFNGTVIDMGFENLPTQKHWSIEITDLGCCRF